MIISPPGMTENQPWHVDYTGTEGHCFIPLTPLTLLNSTQFVRTNWTGDGLLQVQAASHIHLQNLMQYADMSSIEVGQLVCEAYSVLRMVPGTLHRGIANQDTFTRIVFCIVFNDAHIPINEPTITTFGHLSLSGSDQSNMNQCDNQDMYTSTT
jgi:hypothetical protein